MLAGGKEVNYLMINGDVFESSKAWPKLYKFSKSYVKDTDWYYLQRYSDGEIVLQSETIVTTHFIHTQITVGTDYALVFKTMSYKGEEYALTNCLITATEPQANYRDNVYCTVWLKISDFGGGTPIAQNGGVNSPSYLLFIYDIREVAPYVS